MDDETLGLLSSSPIVSSTFRGKLASLLMQKVVSVNVIRLLSDNLPQGTDKVHRRTRITTHSTLGSEDWRHAAISRHLEKLEIIDKMVRGVLHSTIKDTPTSITCKDWETIIRHRQEVDSGSCQNFRYSFSELVEDL